MEPLPRFLLRIAAFCLTVLLLFGGVLLLSAKEPLRTPLLVLTDSAGYVTSAAAEEVLPHIANVQAQDGATALIVGDSVCAQVFDPFSLCNTAYRIDGSNAAVTLAGYSVLVQQFLQNHPDAADVYLVVVPETFARGFDGRHGYQYVAVPFTLTGLLPAFSAAAREELHAAYGWLMHPALARLTEASPLVKKLTLQAVARRVPEPPAGPLPPLSVDSLRYIQTLCDAHGADFHLLCAPLSDTDGRSQTLAALEQAFRAQGLYEQYSAYFTNVYRYPAADFEPDGIHFSFADTTMEDFAAVIARYQADTGLLAGLVTSYD